ncbi:MAG: hypothetical protein O3A00_03350 [Planctomycetota bacterium]|nr:hypothetical protein [Planctomycetota bacterium]
MNLSQYRDLLQDLQDDVDRKEKSVLELRNLKDYAAKKLERPENVERYRPVLIEATRDLNVAQAEVEELRGLAQHVQRKLGEAIQQAPSSFPTTTRPEREPPPTLRQHANVLIPAEAQFDESASDTSDSDASDSDMVTSQPVAGSQPVARPKTELHSRTVVDQVVDDGSDDFQPAVRPNKPIEPSESIDEKPRRRSSIDIDVSRIRSGASKSRSRGNVSSSSETLQSAGESPLVNLKPIEIPPELEQQHQRKKRVSLDSSETKGTIEFGEEDMPITPFD